MPTFAEPIPFEFDAFTPPAALTCANSVGCELAAVPAAGAVPAVFAEFALSTLSVGAFTAISLSATDVAIFFTFDLLSAFDSRPGLAAASPAPTASSAQSATTIAGADR